MISKKLLMGSGIVAALAAVYGLTPLGKLFSLRSVIQRVDPIRANPWAGLIFFVAYTASCVLAPVTAFPIAGGVLFGFWKGFLLNTLAANLGAWITFFIARHYGREAVERLVRGKLKFFDEGLTRHGLWAILTLRIVGFPPFLVVNYGAGLSGVKVWDFVVGTFLGMLVWTVILTYFADTLWQAVTAAGN